MPFHPSVGPPIVSFAPLRLKRNEERRLRAGHLWVFSNEVDIAATPLTAFSPGQLVTIESSRGGPLGTAYVNPRSLICARLLSRRVLGNADAVTALLQRRLADALTLRQRLYRTPHYRLVHAEGDGLPGLVVDRYGDHLVMQVSTAGTEALRDAVVGALVELLQPAGILARNDGFGRELEGLATGDPQVLYGSVPEFGQVLEGGLDFTVPLHGGQKSGWYFDQRPNRERLRAYVGDGRVLDGFSYVGAWGLQAAAAGATQVLCVDASAPALALLSDNAQRNGLGNTVETRQGDAFDVLASLLDAGERFDLVAVDPPAFIKRKRDAEAGMEAYQRLNRLAMQLVVPGGFLVSASCSHHLPEADFRDLLRRAALPLNRRLQMLERGHQGADHPQMPGMPEADYLKVAFCRVL
ncbi:SAM-dependent methyltransferase [Immundisolibacter cernigliae]|uniref:SAM-dependent methyltransferase n=1 Tax=Immundisolibacter cernigliae TaxID=1810504 RepID=A0A1B1YSA6_9GAMM|nr:SAM-dependent methyltransferase [Immundisolibacter cernigliae]